MNRSNKKLNKPYARTTFCAFSALVLSLAFYIAPAICAMPGDADECTLMGAAGYSAAGGGTMVLKNRDRNTRFIQSLCFEKPDNGYAFIGIKNLEKTTDKYAYTMGINEKGLICVSSSAPKKIDFDFGDEKFRVFHPGHILKNIATVDEFIEKILKGKKLLGSMNYIVADARKMCLVEVVNKDHFDYRVVINGTVCQTNHYYFDSMKKYQVMPPARSSDERLKRALKLAEGGMRTFTASDLMRFSCDHGPDGIPSNLTICRHPDMEYLPQKFDGGTISSMVLVSNRNSNPAAYISVGQPCTASRIKIEIINGVPKINEMEREFLKDGTVNAVEDLKRDAWYHFAVPFFYNNPLTKEKEVSHAEE